MNAPIIPCISNSQLMEYVAYVLRIMIDIYMQTDDEHRRTSISRTLNLQLIRELLNEIIPKYTKEAYNVIVSDKQFRINNLMQLVHKEHLWDKILTRNNREDETHVIYSFICDLLNTIYSGLAVVVNMDYAIVTNVSNDGFMTIEFKHEDGTMAYFEDENGIYTKVMLNPIHILIEKDESKHQIERCYLNTVIN